MSFWARLRNWIGGDPIRQVVVSTTNLSVPEGVAVLWVSTASTQTVATIGANQAIIPGRQLRLIGYGAGTITFTNNSDTTTKGQMDLGGSDRSVATQDVLDLIQNSNGAYVMTNFTDN